MKYLLIVLTVFISGTASGQHVIKLKEELLLQQPPFAQCHASTLVSLSDHRLLVAFFGGSHESDSDVCIWTMRQSGKGWEQPVKVAEGITDTVRYACWNPVLFQPASGPLWLFYKVGPNPRAWKGLYKTSIDQGQSWSSPIALAEGILGPVKNKPVQLKDGTLLSPTSVEVTENRWQAYIERSTDGGASWTKIPIDTASTYKVIQPSILQYADGRLQVLCRSNQNRLLSAWSDNKGLQWSRLDTTTIPNPNAGTDAVSLRNGWQLLVYNSGVQGKEWFNSRGKLAVAMSKDGLQWKEVLLLEDGKDGEEFSYPAVIQTPDGLIHITYTWRRTNIKHVVLKQR